MTTYTNAVLDALAVYREVDFVPYRTRTRVVMAVIQAPPDIDTSDRPFSKSVAALRSLGFSEFGAGLKRRNFYGLRESDGCVAVFNKRGEPIVIRFVEPGAPPLSRNYGRDLRDVIQNSKAARALPFVDRWVLAGVPTDKPEKIDSKKSIQIKHFRKFLGDRVWTDLESEGWIESEILPTPNGWKDTGRKVRTVRAIRALNRFESERPR